MAVDEVVKYLCDVLTMIDVARVVSWNLDLLQVGEDASFGFLVAEGLRRWLLRWRLRARCRLLRRCSAGLLLGGARICMRDIGRLYTRSPCSIRWSLAVNAVHAFVTTLPTGRSDFVAFDSSLFTCDAP